MKTCIHSEIGRLEGVVIHTPGTEIENMTPMNAERALYSDILNLSIATNEFEQLKGVLQKVSTVFEVKDLLSRVLSDNKAQNNLLKAICETEKTVKFDELANIAPEELSRILIEGLALPKNNLTNYLSNERFLMRPLHNLFFTRDSAMGVNNHMLIGKMANRVRERESLLMDAIFRYHPGMDTQILNFQKPETGITRDKLSTIEGGDVQIARDDIFVIGTGIRTSTQGIDFIIENIRKIKKEKHHVIVQELPASPESFIHLDMIFTFLNTHECMVYAPIVLGINRFRTIHFEIEKGKVQKIEEHPNILAALKKLGMDMQPICCGGVGDTWVQEREQWHSGANFFAFAPGKLIGYQRNTHTIDELHKNGYEVIPAHDVISGKILPDDYAKCVVTIAGSELARGGGGARCMTLPVRRAKVNWDN